MSIHVAFGNALAELWLRDGIGVDKPLHLAHDVAAAFARGGDGVRTASALLTESGVRAEWNRILADKRSRALASRIRPLATEPLLDVLSGDGSICEALAEGGLARLAATERPGDYAHYGASRLPAGARFEPYSDDLDLRSFQASTALVCAVLHHEKDPARLLDKLAQAGIPRWIVIENCITPEFPPAFHVFADVFFNTCLNDIGVHCGDEHRTLAGWRELLGTYGTVTVAAESFMAPGIPFPYSLLVVERLPELAHP